MWALISSQSAAAALVWAVAWLRVKRHVLELFFDLYVFAIGQLSHQLLAHPTWTGAAQTLVLYLAVDAAWAYTTWAVTLVPAEDPRTRRMLLARGRAAPLLRTLEPSQFTSWTSTKRAEGSRLLPSMGSLGDCCDDAMIESFTACWSANPWYG